jgi:hypothetical protein
VDTAFLFEQLYCGNSSNIYTSYYIQTEVDGLVCGFLDTVILPKMYQKGKKKPVSTIPYTSPNQSKETLVLEELGWPKDEPKDKIARQVARNIALCNSALTMLNDASILGYKIMRVEFIAGSIFLPRAFLLVYYSHKYCHTKFQ